MYITGRTYAKTSWNTSLLYITSSFVAQSPCNLGITCLYSFQQTLPSVIRALKSKGAQLALCHELSLRAKQHRSVLEHDQFDLVVRLLNSALQVGRWLFTKKKIYGVPCSLKQMKIHTWSLDYFTCCITFRNFKPSVATRSFIFAL